MFDYRSSGISISLLLGVAAATPACAEGPGAGSKLRAEDASISPNRALRVEQYSKDMKDDGFLYNSGPSTGIVGMRFF